MSFVSFSLAVIFITQEACVTNKNMSVLIWIETIKSNTDFNYTDSYS